MTQLRALGFEEIPGTGAVDKIIGRIEIAKLESLLDVEDVRFVAPHYHRNQETKV